MWRSSAGFDLSTSDRKFSAMPQSTSYWTIKPSQLRISNQTKTPMRNRWPSLSIRSSMWIARKPMSTTTRLLQWLIAWSKGSMGQSSPMGRRLPERPTRWRARLPRVSTRNQELFPEWLFKFSIPFLSARRIFSFGLRSRWSSFIWRSWETWLTHRNRI